MPDDRAHHFTIRHAAEQIVRGVPQAVSGDGCALSSWPNVVDNQPDA